MATNSKVVATFSSAINVATLIPANFTVTGPGLTPIVGTLSYDDTSAVFTPASNLPASATITATITTGVMDTAGVSLASNYVWTFMTGATADVTPPMVTSTIPANAATGVAINTTVSATFDKAMDPSTLSGATFNLTGPAGAVVSGVVTYDVASATATFSSSNNLAPQTTYTATVKKTAEDFARNGLATDFVWTFNTGTPTGEAPVALGAAGPFVVLAGSTVTATTTAGTTITGNLGVWSGTAVAGFPPGIVNGAIHRGDTAAMLAKHDLTTAYLDAAARSTAPITKSGNLGGQTLVPGLYKSTSSLAISSGDLTLDAQGDSTGVFIFQMASTLTTTAGRKVILAGGAKAANIYWQVGSSATLGTDSVFKGNILAQTAITLTTGATLEGRALTQTAAVSLDKSTITKPAP